MATLASPGFFIFYKKITDMLNVATVVYKCANESNSIEMRAMKFT